MDISSISGMSETSINFTNSQESGHKHDGIVSALIDTSKYSVFDFSPSLIDISDPNRRNIQQSNLDSLRTFVVNVINGSTISPEQINIKANTITSTQIAAGTITSTEISSDFILVNNQISSNNYVAGSDGWLISSNGFAEFSNITIRGAVNSNTGVIGGWTIASNGFSSNTSYSNGGIDRISTITMAPAQNSAGTSFLLAQETYTSGTINVTQYNSLGGQRVISSGIYVDSSTSQTQTLTTSLEQYTISISDALKWTSNNTAISSKITTIDPYDALFSGNIEATGTVYSPGSFTSGTGYSAPSGGSAASPKYSFTGDTNTGMYSSTADRIEIAAGGTDHIISVSGSSYFAAGTTTNTGTWRVGIFNSLLTVSSNENLKNTIKDLDGELAHQVLEQIRPVSFYWNPLPDDSPETAELRPYDLHIGFIAEWMADVDAPFSLAEFKPPNTDGMTPEEAASAVSDLTQWTPTYWKEPHMISLLTAGLKYTQSKVVQLEEKVIELENQIKLITEAGST